MHGPYLKRGSTTTMIETWFVLPVGSNPAPISASNVRETSDYCSLAKSARLILLHCQKLEVSLRDDNLFTGSSGKTSLGLSKCFSRTGCWAYGGWLCCYTTRVAAGKLPLIVTSKPQYFCSAFRLSQLPSLSPTFHFVCANHNFWQTFANCRWAKDSTMDTQDTASGLSTGVLRHSYYVLATRFGTTLSLLFRRFGE